MISRSGCYFRTVDTQKSGVDLRLRIEWRGSSFETRARVVHSIAGDGMGVAFIDTDPEQLGRLLHWLDELAKADANS